MSVEHRGRLAPAQRIEGAITVVETMDPAASEPSTHVPPDTLTVTAPDGRPLGVCAWGAPDGPALFFLHGTPGSRYLRHADDLYRELGLRAITYDRPGYGFSTRKEGRRVADAAADVEAIADALDLDRFAVVGVSGGGPHALAVAALLPDRVARCATIVTIAPPTATDLDFYAGMAEEDVEAWRGSAEASDALEAECAEAMRWSLNAMDGFSTGVAAIDAMLVHAFMEAFRQGPGGVWDDRTALIGDWGFAVEDVRAPTQVMMAREDTSVPTSHWRWYEQHLPHGSVVPVDGGHMGPREKPERGLLAWLAAGAD